MADRGTLYYAELGDETCEIIFDGDSLTVDGTAVRADISTLPGSDRHHLRLDGRSVGLFARKVGEEWSVELEGRLFKVRVEDERTRHIRELASHTVTVDTVRELRAPMPGLIVRVEVSEGQKVDEGDSLIVMEAMKMENELRAEIGGVVVSVDIEAGQAVERDAVLLRLETR